MTDLLESAQGGIAVPRCVQEALAAGATLSVSVSGGKDGQAALSMLSAMRAIRGWPGRFVALHADLGRFEWPQTASAVDEQARRHGAELVVVRRKRGDLLQRIEQEADRLAGTGRQVFPSASARYCTSDLKRDVLVSAQRRMGGVVVSAQGLRAQESPSRAARPSLAVEGRATSARLRRLGAQAALAARAGAERVVLNWLPIHALREEDVWRACGTSREALDRRRAAYAAGSPEALEGWPCHPAYVYGSSRVSCAACVISSEADLRIGLAHNQALAASIAAIEGRAGQSFRRGRPVGPRQAALA